MSRVSYLQQVLPVLASGPDEQRDINHSNDYFRDVQSWVGQEICVAEDKSEVDSIRLHYEPAAE